ESGSGKTMTCRAIVRLVHPPGRITHGRILLGGQDLARLSERELAGVRGRYVVMAFQDPMTALNPVLSVERQITEALPAGRAADSRRARAVELLRHVGIPDPERRLAAYPHELSGGQRQRVMLAIALAREPKLLLADEPTTALDVTIQAQILRLLVNLHRELGMALILVTHDLGVVYQSVDRGAVMYAGGGGAGARRRALRAAAPPVHDRPDPVDPERRAPRPAGPDPGHAARSDEPRPWVPLRPALRVGGGRVPSGRRAAHRRRVRSLEP